MPNVSPRATCSDTPSTGQATTTVKAVNVLMSSGRALTAADVFRAGSGWEDFLTQRAVRDIAAQFHDYQFTPPERDVHETATQPHLWLITDHALAKKELQAVDVYDVIGRYLGI